MPCWYLKILWSRKFVFFFFSFNVNGNVRFYPAQIFIQEMLTTLNRQPAILGDRASRFIVCVGVSMLPYFSPYINIILAITKIIKQIGRVLLYDELPSPWCIAAGCSSATEIFIDSTRRSLYKYYGWIIRKIFMILW